MTGTDLKAYRQQLLTLLIRLRGDVATLRDDALGPARDNAEAADNAARIDDLARREADRDVTIGQLASEEHIRTEVEDALARVAAGTYGVCLDCGKAIPSARLRAVPYARFCIACAERHETETLP